MIVTKKALSRRTVLRGLGAAVALPLLDAMVPGLRGDSKSRAPPGRRLSPQRRHLRSMVAYRRRGPITSSRPRLPGLNRFATNCSSSPASIAMRPKRWAMAAATTRAPPALT